MMVGAAACMSGEATQEPTPDTSPPRLGTAKSTDPEEGFVPVLAPDGEHSTIDYVAHAHVNMNDSLWNAGGLQSWGWAVADLEGAAQRAALDKPPLVEDITKLLIEARRVMADQPALLRCANEVLPQQEPAGEVQECLHTIERNRRLRIDVHDQLVRTLFEELGLEHPESHPD